MSRSVFSRRRSNCIANRCPVTFVSWVRDNGYFYSRPARLSRKYYSICNCTPLSSAFSSGHMKIMKTASINSIPSSQVFIYYFKRSTSRSLIIYPPARGFITYLYIPACGLSFLLVFAEAYFFILSRFLYVHTRERTARCLEVNAITKSFLGPAQRVREFVASIPASSNLYQVSIVP